MIVPIKNIFNENCLRGISKKVTIAFRAKELSGEFLGGFTSYGYINDPKIKTNL